MYVRVRPATRGGSFGGWGGMEEPTNGIRPRLLGCSTISELTVACAVYSYDITGGLSGDRGMMTDGTGGQGRADRIPCCTAAAAAAAACCCLLLLLCGLAVSEI